jgi:predicted permease
LRLEDPKHHCLRLVGRLKAEIPRDEAERRMQVLASRLAEENPDANKDYTIELGKLTRISMNTYRREESGPATTSVLVLAMSGAVLLIACLNLANMMLARGASRRKEIAVRLSLGGGRVRVIRQLLTESLVLAIIGGAAGLLLAYWANQLLIRSLEAKVTFFTMVVDARPDWRVILATFGFCLLSVLLFGLGPAWRLSRLNVTTELKEQVGEQVSSGLRRSVFTPRSLLVVGQLALSLGLLTAAIMFTRGAMVALAANPGFSFHRGLLVETDARLGGFEQEHGRQVYLNVLERIRAMPGIEAASLAYIVPFGLMSDGRQVSRVSGSVETNATAGHNHDKGYAGINIIAQDYFRTLGIPLLRGRDFDRLETTTTNASRVAIIDETLARDLFGEEDPIGRNIQFTDATQALEVVGVVGNVKDDLTVTHCQPHVYVPFGQEYRSGMNIHARVSAERRALKQASSVGSAKRFELPTRGLQ